MPSAEENLKLLVRTLIHDVRNQINGMVLELTDLRERWPDPRVTEETSGLMRQTMEMAERLKDVRERLEPSAPRKQRLALAEAWAKVAPSADPLASPVGNAEIELDLAQIKLTVAELVANAVEAGSAAAVPHGRVEGKSLLVTVENDAPSAPAEISQWGALPGYTTKRRHLGLGNSYARAVMSAHGGEINWRYDSHAKKVMAEVRLPLA